MGIKKGDRVAIFLCRSIESVITLFAIYLVGGVAIIINDRLKRRQINYIIEHSETSLLITDSHMLMTVPDILIDSKRIIKIDRIAFPNERIVSGPVIGTDLAHIIYTSGSTGLPKGIMLSHSNLISGAYIVSDYLKLTGNDIIISLLPFSFDYGLNQLLTAILVDGTLVIQRSLFPGDICNTLLSEKITGMAGVPTLWVQLAQSYSPFLSTNFPNLRYITNSGGRFPENLIRMFRKSHPHVDIYLMYGLTEAFRSTYLPPDQVDIRPTSIGRAIPNVEILVINEQGLPCKPGEVGELVHRGANISLGYWRDPEATTNVFRPHPLQRDGYGLKETVVYSGDLVKSDKEGYLYFIGRKDQLIKSQGVRVCPEEIEECIYASQLVANVVVFAIPKNEVEIEIISAIIPKEPKTFRKKKLLEFCSKEMPEYMKPQVFWCLDEFPQTTSGKPDRAKIKEIYLKKFKQLSK